MTGPTDPERTIDDVAKSRLGFNMNNSGATRVMDIDIKPLSGFTTAQLDPHATFVKFDFTRALDTRPSAEVIATSKHFQQLCESFLCVVHYHLAHKSKSKPNYFDHSMHNQANSYLN